MCAQLSLFRNLPREQEECVSLILEKSKTGYREAAAITPNTLTFPIIWSCDVPGKILERIVPIESTPQLS